MKKTSPLKWLIVYLVLNGLWWAILLSAVAMTLVLGLLIGPDFERHAENIFWIGAHLLFIFPLVAIVGPLAFIASPLLWAGFFWTLIYFVANRTSGVTIRHKEDVPPLIEDVQA